MDSVAYLRVSSRAQDFSTQKAAIERAAAARGDTIANWYSEKRSGKLLARPELDRLRRDARAGAVSRLYVYRLDRLTRSGIRDTFEVIEELRAHGCVLVSVSDGFDLEGPAAEVVLAVLAWASKMERLAINERISAARERVEAEGGRWGRPSRVDEAMRSKLLALRTGGRTVREIAVAMKLPRSTVARHLTMQGQTQLVSSDRGTGQMVQVSAVSSQLATLESAAFPVTGEAPFQLLFTAKVAPSTLGSGYFLLAFIGDGGPRGRLTASRRRSRCRPCRVFSAGSARSERRHCDDGFRRPLSIEPQPARHIAGDSRSHVCRRCAALAGLCARRSVIDGSYARLGDRGSLETPTMISDFGGRFRALVDT